MMKNMRWIFYVVLLTCLGLQAQVHQGNLTARKPGLQALQVGGAQMRHFERLHQCGVLAQGRGQFALLAPSERGRYQYLRSGLRQAGQSHQIAGTQPKHHAVLRAQARQG